MNNNQRQFKKKFVYPLFTKEIRQKISGEKFSIRNEIRQLRSAIKVLKFSLKTDYSEEKLKDLETLKNQLNSLREKNRQSNTESRVLRKTVKAQLRVLRRRNNEIDDESKNLIEQYTAGDTWKTRIPHMQKFFPAHDENARSHHANKIDEIFSHFNGEESVERVRDLIDEYMLKAACQPHVIDVSVLDALVFGLSVQNNFVRLITRIMESQKLFNDFVNESYHHDLFHKTVLLGGKLCGWKLRMHIFVPLDFTEAQEEVHSHRNHFVSCIVHGGFRQEIWEEPKHCKPEEEKEFEVINFHKYIYDPAVTSDGTRVFNINPLGRIDLARVDQISVSKGQIYYMHPSVLHSVNAIDGCTITLVLNSPQATEKKLFCIIRTLARRKLCKR